MEQKFTFSLPFFLDNKKLENILKKAFHKYILIKKVEKVSSNFHPLKNPVIK